MTTFTTFEPERCPVFYCTDCMTVISQDDWEENGKCAACLHRDDKE